MPFGPPTPPRHPLFPVGFLTVTPTVTGLLLALGALGALGTLLAPGTARAADGAGTRYEVVAAASDATSQAAARHLRRALGKAGARLATGDDATGKALASALEEPTRWPITEAREALKRARDQMSEFRFEGAAQRLDEAEKVLLGMDS